MESLSQIARMESQSLGSSGVFMILLEITLPDATVLRFTSNNEDVTWPTTTGERFVSFPFELDQINETRKNEVQSIGVKVGNVTRFVQYYVETANGGVGSEVILRVVNSKNMASATPEMILPFLVTGCTCDSKWVNFTLGANNHFQSRFPVSRLIQNYCRFRFKSTYCGYSGAYTTCNKTLADCRLRANSPRFGGFPGMGKEALYL